MPSVLLLFRYRKKSNLLETLSLFWGMDLNKITKKISMCQLDLTKLIFIVANFICARLIAISMIIRWV